MAKLENTIITPWQNDNNYAITKSGVEKQDEFTLEDYLDNPSAGSANLKDTGMQFLSQTYLGKVQNYINDLTGNNYSNPKNYHLRPTAENHPMQSEGKTLENEVLIESGSKSEILVFSIRKTDFIFDHIISIGLKSGLYGGR